MGRLRWGTVRAKSQRGKDRALAMRAGGGWGWDREEGGRRRRGGGRGAAASPKSNKKTGPPTPAFHPASSKRLQRWLYYTEGKRRASHETSPPACRGKVDIRTGGIGEIAQSRTRIRARGLHKGAQGQGGGGVVRWGSPLMERASCDRAYYSPSLPLSSSSLPAPSLLLRPESRARLWGTVRIGGRGLSWKGISSQG